MSIVKLRILPWQYEFLKLQDDIFVLAGGLSSGKTFIVSQWFVDRVMNFPNANHAVVGRDLPQLKRGTLITLRGVLADRGIEHSYNSTKGEITVLVGEAQCTIKALTAMNYLGFRSLELDTIWADELADWTTQGDTAHEAFTRYLAPRLRYSPGGQQYAPVMKPQLRVSTNPPLSTGHWLYELVVRQKYCGYRNVSTRDNYLMKDHAEYIDRLERSMAPDLWPILIDGGWGNAGAGAVYRGFNRTIHGAATKPPLPPVALNTREPILWSLDFNVGLMCSVIAQVYHQQRRFDPTSLRNTFGAPPPVHLLDDYVSLESSEYQRNVLYVLDEIRIPNCGTPDVADEFIKRYGAVARQSGVIVYGDASAGGRSQQIAAQASARSNWAIIAEALKRAGIPAEFRVQTVNPSIMDRINAVKAQFRTKDGIGLHIDLDRCPYLAMDFESVNWREGTNDVDKDSDKTKTHLSDAVGYLIWMERSRAANMAINLLNPFKTAT